MGFLVESRARHGSGIPSDMILELRMVIAAGIGSRFRGSCALSPLLRRRAVGGRSRSNEGSRERPTTRDELPLEVDGTQGALGRSERHHHDRGPEGR